MIPATWTSNTGCGYCERLKKELQKFADRIDVNEVESSNTFERVRDRTSHMVQNTWGDFKKKF